MGLTLPPACGELVLPIATFDAETISTLSLKNPTGDLINCCVENKQTLKMSDNSPPHLLITGWGEGGCFMEVLFRAQHARGTQAM